jgi:hypothetical protein
MKKFEKAVAASALSLGLAGGMVAVGASVDSIQNQDRRACYADLDGTEQNQCLSEVSLNTGSESLLQLGVAAGIIAAVAAGVQAYRALDKMSSDSEIV